MQRRPTRPDLRLLLRIRKLCRVRLTSPSYCKLRSQLQYIITVQCDFKLHALHLYFFPPPTAFYYIVCLLIQTSSLCNGLAVLIVNNEYVAFDGMPETFNAFVSHHSTEFRRGRWRRRGDSGRHGGEAPNEIVHLGNEQWLH